MAAVMMMTASDPHDDSCGTCRSRRGDHGGGPEKSSDGKQRNQKSLHGNFLLA
jgi:hypothetical protein